MGERRVSINQVELVPAIAARRALAERVDLGDFAVSVDKENPLVGGFVKGTVRFALTWTTGRLGGEGFIELMPLSRVSTQMEIGLSKPSGVWGFTWNAEKLRHAAARVALAIRSEFESRPEISMAREAPARGRVRIGRPIPAGES